MASIFGGGGKGPDYAAIERQRKAEAEAAEREAKEKAFSMQKEKQRTLRGRGSLLLDDARETLG